MAADDPVLAALDEVEACLQENLGRIHAALARVGHIRAARAKGLSYREIVPQEARPLIVEMVTANLEALQSAGSHLRQAQARALYDDGLTMEQIAELFGVTRQRVFAILNREARD